MKYVVDRERWMIFGEADGMVDIADPQHDVLEGVPRELADRIIAAHNQSLERALQHAAALHAEREDEFRAADKARQ